MARKPRIHYSGAFYHVILRVHMHSSKMHGRFLTDSNDSDDDNDTEHETESEDNGKETNDLPPLNRSSFMLYFLT